MKHLFIIVPLFILLNPLSAETWENDSSDSVPSGMSVNKTVVFPYSSAASFTCASTYPVATMGGKHYLSGTLIDTRTASSPGYSFTGVQVTAGTTYTLNTYCTSGSGDYNKRIRRRIDL